ncbi:MAG: response regulator [Nitrospirae bacterium]|nr:MAG: response regulator [Nitrospirota bacterium]
METQTAKTVMIVDDDATSRKLLKSILTALGIKRIDEQENGEGAWEKLQHQRVDVILADWHMAEMSGLELLKHIRSDARFAHIKVVMVTSEDRRAHIMEAIKAGVNGYIMKPFSKQNIAEKIHALFSPSTASTETSSPSSTGAGTAPSGITPASDKTAATATPRQAADPTPAQPQ